VLKTSVEMILLAVLSIGISYVLWESGMRKGNNRILGLASYFVPIASMAVATCYWRESFHAGLFAGSALVVVGALISKASLKDSTEK